MEVLPLLLFLGSFADVALGNPVKQNVGRCNKPLFSVIGNHYSPNSECEPVSSSDLIRQYEIVEKYYNLIVTRRRVINEEDGRKILDNLKILVPLKWDEKRDVGITCTACKAAVDTVRFMLNDGSTPEEILDLLTGLCVDANVMSPEVCQGVMNSYGRVLAEIVVATEMDALEICSFIFNTECGDVTIPEHQWNVHFTSDPKPPLMPHQPPHEDASKLKVLHLSDTHFDRQYAEGSWAECSLPLCCRVENELPDENATTAGKWGGWKCDTNERTFDHLLQHIITQHPDIDYIYWTGDLPSHDIWDQTQESNLDALKITAAKLSTAFPNIPIYPALGNHESVPANIYPPPAVGGESNMDWLYSVVAEQWHRWLPDNASETIRLGAFYTTLVRPGLRVVSMNMNYCYNMNWWLMLNSTDPVQELDWFINVLQLAELNGEKVHVIGHVPAGHSDCLKVWQENYIKIITRYEGTVTAQFFGHTHNDEFEVLYDLEDMARPVAVGYIGPSLTTYTYLNPGYRIYYIDGDYENSTRFVVDHETWFFDLDRANKYDDPVWSKMYSAKEAYNMTSLFPEDWDKLYQRLLVDENLLQQYHRYYWKDSPTRPECNRDCKRKRLCDIRACLQYGEPQSERY